LLNIKIVEIILQTKINKMVKKKELNTNEKRVLFVIPFITHYRVNFYKILNEKLNSNLILLHEIKNKNDGRPSFSNEVSIENYTFKSKKILFFNFNFGVLEHFKRIKPNIVLLDGHVGNLTFWVVIILAKLSRIKVVLWVCSWEKYNNWIINKIRRLSSCFLFNLADKCIAYGSVAETYMKEIGVKSKKICIAYNGIDIINYENTYKIIKDNSLVIRSNYPENAFIFLYVGGVFKDKKVDLLLSSFLEIEKKHQNAYLWIIGDGPNKIELETKFGLLSKCERIKFWGRIDNDVEKYFCAADFFVLPGVGGLALCESLLWGTPCIVSKADGTERDLIFENINGFYFSQHNKLSLIKAMENAISLNRSKLNEMSINSINQILKRSNTSIMSDIFMKVFDEI
jgi:glycosyltransferase involved in cell wall biosynthesis